LERRRLGDSVYCIYGMPEWWEQDAGEAGQSGGGEEEAAPGALSESLSKEDL